MEQRHGRAPAGAAITVGATTHGHTGLGSIAAGMHTMLGMRIHSGVIGMLVVSRVIQPCGRLCLLLRRRRICHLALGTHRRKCPANEYYHQQCGENLLVTQPSHTFDRYRLKPWVE